jgi:GTP cyclohydrolase I
MTQPYCFASNTRIPKQQPVTVCTDTTMKDDGTPMPLQSEHSKAGMEAAAASSTVPVLKVRTRLPPGIPEYVKNAVASVSQSRIDPAPIDLEADDEEEDVESAVDSNGAAATVQVVTTTAAARLTGLGTKPDPILMLHQLPIATEPLAKDVEKACLHLIQALNLPAQLDSANLSATASRMARVYISMTRGLYRHDPFTETLVEAKDHGLSSQVIGPIDIQTTCSQHLLPVYGSCTISIVRPRIIKGTTRYLRYLRWLTSRPWLQEELGTEIAERFCAITQSQKVEVALAIEQLSLDPQGAIARHKVLTRHQARASDTQMPSDPHNTPRNNASTHFEENQE